MTDNTIIDVYSNILKTDPPTNKKSPKTSFLLQNISK